MILTRPEDAVHRIQLLRLLSEILDDSVLADQIYFKGGSCASMLGYLDRFSVDLDFDAKDETQKKGLADRLQVIFKNLDLEIRQKSKNELFYVLKYQSEASFRNTLKLGILKQQAKSNVYKPFYLKEIDRFAICQTKETMFSHKLVSPIDRYKKYKSIAGRDIYDIHHFFLKGYDYIKAIIKERTGKGTIKYFKELKEFIAKKVTDKTLSEDLNYLLPSDKFQKVRKILKRETLLFLADELKRLSKSAI